MKKEHSFWIGKISAVIVALLVILTAFLSLPNSASAALCSSKKSCATASISGQSTQKQALTKFKTQVLLCPTGMKCGSYTISGLGIRKQQLLKAGSSTLDLSAAMLETDTMRTTYLYSDGKNNDAANFGIFKQNWYMLRSTCSHFRGQAASQFNKGVLLNTSLSSDVTCLKQSQSFYGLSIWFAGERNGQTGIHNPNTADINRYKTAVYWIQSRLTANSANLSNDTRFWVEVPAI